MPTEREREYYRMGFRDAMRDAERDVGRDFGRARTSKPPKKRSRKLSGWQKYIKNKRNHIKYRDGKLNLKKMGVAYRRKKRR
jgi:hypothetical protein